jgi:hypothetical protein
LRVEIAEQAAISVQPSATGVQQKPEWLKQPDVLRPFFKKNHLFEK